MLFRTRLAIIGLCYFPTVALAQFSFKLGEQDVQVHSFASQGYALSNQNNFLTMKTSDGSFAMTDGGVNITTSIRGKWFFGAQGYIYNVGQMGNGKVYLDWATASYKAKDWFGIRAGKVKTALGLYTNTQDAESTYTWAMLPQSVYPIDLRSSNIAHWGLDFFGKVELNRFGSVAYTVYGGFNSADPRAGQYLSTHDYGAPTTSLTSWMQGMDLRWTTPVAGLTGGVSFLNQPNRTKLYLGYDPSHSIILAQSTPQHITSAYSDYVRGKWHFSGEFRRDYNLSLISPGQTITDSSYSAGFITAAYRVNSRLEIGTYHSRFFLDVPFAPNSPDAQRHIIDQAVTARVDLARFWNVKAEGHFMDGYGDVFSAHGFYSGTNPQGLQPRTNLFVLRSGWNF